jgi:hypothetical protein
LLGKAVALKEWTSAMQGPAVAVQEPSQAAGQDAGSHAEAGDDGMDADRLLAEKVQAMEEQKFRAAWYDFHGG